jgi:DNA-binding MltR family transcriptional regulator
MAKPPKTRVLIDPTKFEEFGKFFAELTERGAALAAVANLDSDLADCLKLVMVKDDDAINQMFGEQGSLSAFGARVRFSYLLRLIDKQMYKELLTINKIRNAFAHKKDVDSFTHPNIQGHASNLLVMKDPPSLVPYISYFSDKYYPSPPEVQWRVFSDIMLNVGHDVTMSNWAFMTELSIISNCFAKAARDRVIDPPGFLFP